jgi:hypothetical protein
MLGVKGGIGAEIAANVWVAGVRAQELPGQLGVPGLAVVPAGARRYGQLQVHADVDDHLRGVQQLLVEHPEPVAGVIEVAQLVHEPFGVQCPALTVAGDERQRALPAVEPVRSEVPLRDLQVMAGYSLVVDSGDLLPGRELVDAVGR